MKNYDEIKKIITETYGITDLSAYKEFLKKWRESGGVTTSEQIELLSPDNINCRDFWRVCGDIFGTDPICNAADGAVYADDMDANRNNFQIAEASGVIAPINVLKHFRCNVLEYGPGLGSFKNYVEVMTKFTYFGFDVNPRIPGVRFTTEMGYLPEEFVAANAGKFNIIFSSNVLQHVSDKQRRQFFHDAFTLLGVGGYLVFNVACQFPKEDGTRPCMTLYGQFIPVPDISDIISEIRGYDFDRESMTVRGSLYGLCYRKVLPMVAGATVSTKSP